MKSVSVAIALATYNGEKYLQQLLASLIAQTFVNWKVVVRDDESSDSTINVLARFRNQFPKKIVLIEDHYGNLGPKGNFNRILKYISEEDRWDYVFLADQDDIWVPNKLELMIENMREIDRLTNQPLLLHTDMSIIDERDYLIEKSFWKYQNLKPQFGCSIKNLVVQNVITGCASVMNKALLSKALPIPDDCIMHDWWLAIVASAFGRINYLSDATVLYRQHEKNTLGALKYVSIKNVKRALKIKLLKNKICTTQRQTSVFLERYYEELEDSIKEDLALYARLNELGFFQRRWVSYKHGFKKIGLMRNIGFYLAM